MSVQALLPSACAQGSPVAVSDLAKLVPPLLSCTACKRAASLKLATSDQALPCRGFNVQPTLIAIVPTGFSTGDKGLEVAPYGIAIVPTGDGGK